MMAKVRRLAMAAAMSCWLTIEELNYKSWSCCGVYSAETAAGSR
jgi:hypothetical protein